MDKLTVGEKRKAIVEICRKAPECSRCTLQSTCRKVSLMRPPSQMDDHQIEKFYQLIELKGEPTMNEHETQTTLEATIDGTIVITRSEYAYLIAESAKNDLLKDYVNNREYLDKDVVRAILGMYRSEESEG